MIVYEERQIFIGIVEHIYDARVKYIASRRRFFAIPYFGWRGEPIDDLKEREGLKEFFGFKEKEDICKTWNS